MSIYCNECEQKVCECDPIQEEDVEDPEEEEELQTPPKGKLVKKRLFIDMEENSDEPVITTTAAGKRPASMSQFIDDEAEEMEWEDQEKPDLQAYFEQFGLTKQLVIGMCRTFANSLAAQLRAEKSMERKIKD